MGFNMKKIVFLVLSVFLFTQTAFALDVFEVDARNARSEAEALLAVREALALRYEALYNAWSESGGPAASKPKYSDFTGKKASQLELVNTYYLDPDGFSENIDVESTGDDNVVRLRKRNVAEAIAVLVADIVPSASLSAESGGKVDILLLASRPMVMDVSDFVKTNTENIMQWDPSDPAGQSTLQWSNWNTGAGLIETGLLRTREIGKAGDVVSVRAKLEVIGSPTVADTGVFLQDVDVAGTLYAGNIALTGKITADEIVSSNTFAAKNADFEGKVVFGSETNGIVVDAGKMELKGNSTIKTSAGNVEMFAPLASYGVSTAGTTVTASKYGISREGDAVVKNLYVTGDAAFSSRPRIAGKTGVAGSEWDVWVTGLKGHSPGGATELTFKSRPAFVNLTAAQQAANTWTFSYTGAPQSKLLPIGIYQIEAWGAGKNPSGETGGVGYVKGVVKVYKATTVVAYVGGMAPTTSVSGGWNGGGSGGTNGFGGHGATDLRIADGAWTVNAASVGNQTSLLRRIIVAGGGSGSNAPGGGPVAGDGGGDVRDGKGGEQQKGGAGGTVGGVTGSTAGAPGLFGKAQAAGGYGGGGGWYGGGGGAKKGTKLVTLKMPPPTGGQSTSTINVVEDGKTVQYMIHTFTSLDTASTKFYNQSIDGLEVDYLIIGGGGSSGKGGSLGNCVLYSGGGGAGGFVEGKKAISKGTYQVIVGAGGPCVNKPQNGSPSSVFGVSALGGGHGATGYTGWDASQGASGGGGTHNYIVYTASSNVHRVTAKAAGTAGQGYSGADAASGKNYTYCGSTGWDDVSGVISYTPGGGGGAGGPGEPGKGGPGKKSYIDNYSTTYSIGGYNGVYSYGGGGNTRGIYMNPPEINPGYQGIVKIRYKVQDGFAVQDTITAIPDGKAGGGSNYIAGVTGFNAVDYSGNILNHPRHPSGIEFEEAVSSKGVTPTGTEASGGKNGRLVIRQLQAHNSTGTWSEKTMNFYDFIRFIEDNPDSEFLFPGEPGY